jgi:hypothetical protein
MGAPPMVRVSIVFIDRGGRKGATSFLFSASVSPQSAIAWAIDTASVIEDISDAKAIQAKYEYRVTIDEPDEPSFTSDVHRRAILFYRNEDEIEAISIPSADTNILESTGRYQGVRVDALNSEVVAFNATILALAGSLATKEGEPFPGQFEVGGLAV